MDIAENVSKLSKKINVDLVFMIGVMRNNCSRPKSLVTQTIKRRKVVKREFVDHYCVSGIRDSTMVFVESRAFLFDPARYVGGSVFNLDVC